ncbi:MAG: hypothetical protein LRY74_17355 [Shewanella xiamenensis]|nr:hypothetical protein [Shewanella xiamenensis]
MLLGKEQIESQHYDQVDLAARLTQLLSEMAQHFAKHEIRYQLSVNENTAICAPVSFVDIVIGNLIKNAFNYSSGDIEITLNNNQLTIKNPLSHHSAEPTGYGCGLIIIERICERMGWHFLAQSLGNDYLATIQFMDNGEPQQHLNESA